MKRLLLIAVLCLGLLGACAQPLVQDGGKDCMQLCYGDSYTCGGIRPDGPPIEVAESSLGEEYYYAVLCEYLLYSCKKSCGIGQEE